MNQELSDLIGELVDKAENYLQYGAIVHEPMKSLPPVMRIDALTRGLMEVRDALRKVYVESALNDPWDGDPSWSALPEASR